MLSLNWYDITYIDFSQVLENGVSYETYIARILMGIKEDLGEKSKYTGRILAVGISYSTKTKEHQCEVEELRSGLFLG